MMTTKTNADDVSDGGDDEDVDENQQRRHRRWLLHIKLYQLLWFEISVLSYDGVYQSWTTTSAYNSESFFLYHNFISIQTNASIGYFAHVILLERDGVFASSLLLSMLKLFIWSQYFFQWTSQNFWGGVQGWRSGESTRLPPMRPVFDFQTRCHMWVEFVGSLLSTERFSPGTPVFPLLKDQHLT